MIAYFKCLCKSRDKIIAKRLASEGYEIRLTDHDPVAAKQSKEFGLRLPFGVVNGVAKSLYE